MTYESIQVILTSELYYLTANQIDTRSKHLLTQPLPTPVIPIQTTTSCRRYQNTIISGQSEYMLHLEAIPGTNHDRSSFEEERALRTAKTRLELGLCSQMAPQTSRKQQSSGPLSRQPRDAPSSKTSTQWRVMASCTVTTSLSRSLKLTVL